MSALLSTSTRGTAVLQCLVSNLTNSCSCELPSSKSLENFFPPALSVRMENGTMTLRHFNREKKTLLILRPRACVCLCAAAGQMVEEETAVKAGTFELLEGLGTENVHPHRCQLLFSQVNLIHRSLVLGQLIYQCLGLKQRDKLVSVWNHHNIWVKEEERAAVSVSYICLSYEITMLQFS